MAWIWCRTRRPLELHRLRAALHQAGAVADGVFGPGLERGERQVDDQERARLGADHGAKVVRHLRHRDRDRRLVAEHDHPERIADQDQVDSASSASRAVGKS